jgi:ABC-type oligopeptide transport system substrate-binding subunit
MRAGTVSAGYQKNVDSGDLIRRFKMRNGIFVLFFCASIFVIFQAKQASAGHSGKEHGDWIYRTDSSHYPRDRQQAYREEDHSLLRNAFHRLFHRERQQIVEPPYLGAPDWPVRTKEKRGSGQNCP